MPTTSGAVWTVISDYAYIEAAAHAGAITGYPDGSFRPNQNVSWVQVVVITERVRAYALYTPTSPTF